MSTTGVVGAAAAVGLGAAAGAGLRALLVRIPRGMPVRRGPLEVAGAGVTLLGFLLVGPGARLAPVVFAGVLLVGLGVVDAAHHRLPDALTLPAVPVALILLVVTGLIAPGSGSLPRAGVCAVAVTLAFALVARLSPRSMGRGDVKLVPTLGLLTGYLSVASTVVAVALAFLLGALVAVGGLATRRMNLRSALPFGPFLLAGTWCALVFPGLPALFAG